MKDYQSLSHTKWDCKYHVVYIPKRWNQRLYGALRHELGKIFHELANQKGCQILGHCCKDIDELAFRVIERSYLSKTLLTRRISPRGCPK